MVQGFYTIVLKGFGLKFWLTNFNIERGGFKEINKKTCVLTPMILSKITLVSFIDLDC